MKKENWTLCGEYLAYRKDGGKMGPQAWNDRINEIAVEIGCKKIDPKNLNKKHN